jgi:DNA integrity scanning protein DisA with diadenylate cyclase activity
MTALSQIGWRTAIDFVVLASTLYLILMWAKEARALRIVVTIAILHTAAVSARHMSLIITSTVLEGAAVALGFLLLILFQPELRRALMLIESRLQFRAENRSLPQPVSGAIGTAVSGWRCRAVAR